jgi:hypothetical protein
MSRVGIMTRRARVLATFGAIGLTLPGALSAQEPMAGAGQREELDVTLRIIVDPEAKRPDEIVRRIPLPRPARPGAAERRSPAGGEPRDANDAAPPARGEDTAAQAREQGRQFGQDVAARARELGEEARRNAGPPINPPGPPVTPPGPPVNPPGGPPVTPPAPPAPPTPPTPPGPGG